MAKTEYVVLRKYPKVGQGDGEDEVWREVGAESAISAKAAISAVVKEAQTSDVAEGEFVAVPARSWHPVSVRREVKLTFS